MAVFSYCHCAYGLFEQKPYISIKDDHSYVDFLPDVSTFFRLYFHPIAFIFKKSLESEQNITLSPDH